jgi:ABC-type multidrug transport system fused ATPase/permease subunit
LANFSLICLHFSAFSSSTRSPLSILARLSGLGCTGKLTSPWIVWPSKKSAKLPMYAHLHSLFFCIILLFFYFIFLFICFIILIILFFFAHSTLPSIFCIILLFILFIIHYLTPRYLANTTRRYQSAQHKSSRHAPMRPP